jgi:hypothetical protein
MSLSKKEKSKLEESILTAKSLPSFSTDGASASPPSSGYF